MDISMVPVMLYARLLDQLNMYQIDEGSAVAQW